MTVLKQELRSQKWIIIIWSVAIAGLMAASIMMYPEMKSQMDSVSDMFANMGGFTAAFGMDKIDFGTLLGYYMVECGNMIGIGGGLFAAIVGVSALMKEEKERTAEFLFTHPLSRARVITEKLISTVLIVLLLNLFVFVVATLSVMAIGESVPWKEILIYHAANLLMGIEIACICFGISAFIVKGGMGLGIGVAALMYFLNIMANLAKSAEGLKYVTPYGYTDGSYIIEHGSLNGAYVAVGMSFAVIGVVAAYIKYLKKDIRA